MTEMNRLNRLYLNIIYIYIYPILTSRYFRSGFPDISEAFSLRLRGKALHQGHATGQRSSHAPGVCAVGLLARYGDRRSAGGQLRRMLLWSKAKDGPHQTDGNDWEGKNHDVTTRRSDYRREVSMLSLLRVTLPTVPLHHPQPKVQIKSIGPDGPDPDVSLRYNRGVFLLWSLGPCNPQGDPPWPPAAPSGVASARFFQLKSLKKWTCKSNPLFFHPNNTTNSICKSCLVSAYAS